MNIYKTSLRLFICFLCSYSLIGQNEMLEVQGNAKITSLIGGGTRLVGVGSTGILQDFPLGSTGQFLTSNGSSISWVYANNWGLLGNFGTNEISTFIGTTDFEGLRFRTDNKQRMGISATGTTYIGSAPTSPNHHFEVVTDVDFVNGIYNTMTPSTLAFRTAHTNVIRTGVGENGTRIGSANTIFGPGDSSVTGTRNFLQTEGLGIKIAQENIVRDAPGSLFGVKNIMGEQSPLVPGIESGTIHGVNNQIINSNTSLKYGVSNYISDTNGRSYGVYNSVSSGPTNNSIVYGTYNFVSSQAAGSVGGFFSSTGVNNKAAIFHDGEVIVNQVMGDNDTRMASRINDNAFLLDADKDIVIFGTDTPDLSGDGANFAGTTINFAADFDNGANDGTAIGIGSREFLLDGSTETNINNGFAPLLHDTYDLGYSTTERAWNDVYASNFVTMSDQREKSNINDLNYGLDEVLQMRPVSYTLNHDPYGETKLGLIAQEVLPLVNEVVKTHDFKLVDEATERFGKIELERIGMNYQELIPVLIQAIKEQQTQVEELKILAMTQAKAMEIQSRYVEKLQDKMVQLEKSIIAKIHQD